jgi:hypothetical protein
MQFLFSGILNHSEIGLLQKAQINQVLLTPRTAQFNHFFQSAALDSDAYYHYRRGTKLNLYRYLEFAMQGQWLWCAAPDLIGDAQGTFDNWQKTQQWLKSNYSYSNHPPIIPVWQPGTTQSQLQTYLDHSPIVGIGGPLIFRV